MNFKRLTAHVTAIAIGCASTAIFADANYTQRAKEQAERAAAAAAIEWFFSRVDKALFFLEEALEAIETFEDLIEVCCLVKVGEIKVELLLFLLEEFMSDFWLSRFEF